MPLSMNHSPMAAPANGARYWFVAVSDAGAEMIVVYGIAPSLSRTARARATFEFF